MTSFLHVTCGPYGLLFDIDRVVEVGEAPASAFALDGRCLWREQQLPLVDLSLLLGGKHGERPQRLVLDNLAGSDHTLVMLVVDGIESIRECDDRDRIRMPWMNQTLSRFFGGGWLDRETRRCLFEVRLPLDIDSLSEGMPCNE